MFQRILIPLDLDEPQSNEVAIRTTIDFAKNSRAYLRFVYVQSPDLIALSDYGLVDPEDRLRRKAEEEISKRVKSINYAGERVSSVVRLGGVSWEILAEADQWSADLVALGSRRPSIATHLLGSNAATIVRNAKCSVLIIRESENKDKQ
jgi:nucleotide-binding universal stress UspA family protein